MIAGHPLGDTAMDCAWRKKAMQSLRMCCHVLPWAVLTALVASWFVWGPFGVVFYAGGLFNSLWAHMLWPFLLLLIPSAVISLPILTLRIVRRWPTLDLRGKKCRVLAVLVCCAFLGSFALGFTGVMPSPFDMYVRGFWTYALWRMDIMAIRTWLESQDPNESTEFGSILLERRLTESEQPACIARLHPKTAMLSLDDAGRRLVCLLWGGGLIGHWGIEVGRQDMPIPPSDAHIQYFPLVPGAYIWSGE